MDISALLTRVHEVRSTPGGTEALLEQLAQEDPRAQAVLSFLRQQKSTAEPATEPVPDDAGARRYRRLRAAYDELYELVSELAAALGACPRCWGEAAECPLCDGHGAPGSRAPDETGFDRLVRPAIQTLSQLRQQNGRRTQHREYRQSESSPPQED